MSYVREINDPQQLEELRLMWTAMLPSTPGASFFHSLDWLQVYWKHFGAGQQLRVLVLYVMDQPMGILPLAIRRERTRIVSVRLLSYPLHDWGSWFGPIGPHPRAAEGNTEPYLQLGDMFFKATGGNEVLIVLSAACDLAYAPGARREFPTNRYVLFEYGELQPIGEAPREAARDEPARMRALAVEQHARGLAEHGAQRDGRQGRPGRPPEGCTDRVRKVPGPHG